jgi:hypothetical protein
VCHAHQMVRVCTDDDEQPQELQPLGQIPLSECQLLPDSSFKFGFVVRNHVTKRDFHIGASSQVEQSEWYMHQCTGARRCA